MDLQNIKRMNVGVKALQKSVQDNNQRRLAKFLELMEMDEVFACRPGEEAMMNEVENEGQLWGKGAGQSGPLGKEKAQGRTIDGDGRDKGKTKRGLPAKLDKAKTTDKRRANRRDFELV